MKNSEPIQNNLTTTQEQPTLSKENRSLRLTPEQIEMSRQNSEALSKAVIQGLHEDNLEIFGEDYLNPKS
jgi:hypothetical protein